jgi:hypothetical protein
MTLLRSALSRRDVLLRVPNLVMARKNRSRQQIEFRLYQATVTNRRSQEDPASYAN